MNLKIKKEELDSLDLAIDSMNYWVNHGDDCFTRKNLKYLSMLHAKLEILSAVKQK